MDFGRVFARFKVHKAPQNRSTVQYVCMWKFKCPSMNVCAQAVKQGESFGFCAKLVQVMTWNLHVGLLQPTNRTDGVIHKSVWAC
eukprot:1150748-Pelagomonas_calceolata.AAC.6